MVGCSTKQARSETLHTYAGSMQLAKAERHRLIESVVSRKRVGTQFELLDALAGSGCSVTQATVSRDIRETRSEEHTSELQSLRHLVCRLLLEKKKKNKTET